MKDSKEESGDDSFDNIMFYLSALILVVTMFLMSVLVWLGVFRR